MMVPKLITMLTNHDVTVKNAREVFLSCADLACEFWGFKDVGLAPSDMRDLAGVMREKGKTTFLESVNLDEGGSDRAAQLATDCGVDYFLGTIYSPKVHATLAKSKTKYMPFCGVVHGHPTVLDGSPDEILLDAKRLEGLGASGVDLLAYRNPDRPEEAARKLVEGLTIPVIIAGSIDTFERLDRMKQIQPWAFTIGGAFFSKRFVPNGTFRQQMESVIAYLAR